MTPLEAGRAAAQYLPADPALWLEQCALAGIDVRTSRTGFSLRYNSKGPEKEQAQFLEAWLHSTPGGGTRIEACVPLQPAD